MPYPRCVIVDDSPDLRAASQALLERQGVAVVGLAATRAEALEAVARLRPDVALVDIDLGGESGFELVGALAAQTACILISTHDQADFAELIAESPALGFIRKAQLSGERVRALLSGSRGR